MERIKKIEIKNRIEFLKKLQEKDYCKHRDKNILKFKDWLK